MSAAKTAKKKESKKSSKKATMPKSLVWSVSIGEASYAEKIRDLNGAVRLHVNAEPGMIHSVTARLSIQMGKKGRAFFNGYQTWTHSPEYKRDDIEYGITRAPKSLIENDHVDCYGDYHFIDYPAKPGKFHGFSWCYFRNGQKFRLIASLNERPGYTIFRYDAKSGELMIERDIAGVRHEGGEFPAFDLFFAEGTEREVFDAWFAAMDYDPIVGEPIKGYSSWYNRYEDITEETVLEDLAGCMTLFDPGDLFQIDDGWEPNVGDWLDPDPVKFPHGMRAMAQAAHAAGFKAGLWLAPFAASKTSNLYRAHPDWFLQVNGEPWLNGSNWGGFYSLDIDKPEVQEYLRIVFAQVFRIWGFDLVKLDFLYAAAPFGTETESRGARMARAMQLIREWCGDGLILGCGVPVMPAFGNVDYCRIGADVSLNKHGDKYLYRGHRERVSTRNAMDNAVYRRQLDGRAYGSDPDVFFLRDENIKLKGREKKMLAKCNALFGSVLLMSDDPSKYSEKALATYDELMELWHAQITRVEVEDAHSWVVDYQYPENPFDDETHSVTITAP